MKQQIREWTKDDLSTIREIALKTWRDTYLNIFTEEEIVSTHKQYYSSDRLIKLLESKIGFVYTINDEPVAYLIAKKKDEKDRFYINSFYVLPEKQGSGIGKQILESVIKKAKPLGYKEIWLDVMAGNTKAIKWYEHQNFVFVGKGNFKMGNSETETMVGYKTI
ncbi:MAG: GNAT family N-acetyltransferase [Planctomycetia bacterium]|nr:GNAT family N-acetyltransferase [Planctomycetia bacterium]